MYRRWSVFGVDFAARKANLHNLRPMQATYLEVLAVYHDAPVEDAHTQRDILFINVEPVHPVVAHYARIIQD